MIVFRIAKEKWITDLSGIGAKLSGGRWNPKGLPIIYCASTSSLAILEKLVNVDYDLLPDDYFLAELEVPDSSIVKIPIKDLPGDWNQFPSPDKLKEIGKEWIENGKHLILQVPSAVNPTEVNYLLNVQHPLIKKIKIKKTYPISIDERLTK
ncbi:MAG: RES family NAD+ phosphorylase [Eudoraea sp.]|nr:RES family NAD+ phosphorylase [Eudoraea sp.]MBT8292396.1 RES family NAD+ phosphorylase [Eudoraea sp.]NNL03194.1 RES family NAD+ phosphorylase [Eudoraea sp.]